MKTETQIKQLMGAKIFDSKIKSLNVTGAEKWLGYLVGPAGFALMNALIMGYINIYYTDVLKLTDPKVFKYGVVFLTIFPLASRLFDGAMNLIMGVILDRTKSKQGKARPWILISAPFITVSGILMFTIPKASITVQLVWIVISFNLYFGMASVMYIAGHNLMVPLSTRNTAQRGTLSVISNIANTVITGIIVALIFPMIVMPIIGADKGKWIMLMSVISIIALPLIFIEYYFTRERITEENMSVVFKQKLSVKQQIKAVMTNKYWLLLATYQLIFNFGAILKNTSLIYYCNYVLGSYNDGITQTMISVVGGFPMGVGMLVILPLIKRFGNRNVTLAGFILSVIGGVICWMFPTNMALVIIGQFIKNLGIVPCGFVFVALFADVLDHIEWKSNIRCDGISSSIMIFIMTVSSGLSASLFNLMLGRSGKYITPVYNAATGITQGFVQPDSIKNVFTFSFVGVEVIAHIVLIIILIFFNLEKEMPTVQREIKERQKLDCEARGKVWTDPEERARLEQEV
ncbi:MFS transporter [Clostridium fungisolvens]|uniref:Isoprimeverose transporter n=1 Tax=Clostridium fungisolvens TaxID=1604897 RepID=A0A6V8SBS7_9CLOT|nr:MFS transporter [Clostridium fungisolvens]GFP74694.1 Isoprimeverose transporter [Clostridium fungisolvens]